MKFLNIAKIAKQYHAQYVSSGNGGYNPNLKNLGKKGIWIGVNEQNELKVSNAMLNHNDWLDDLAADFANGRVSAEDFE